MKKTLGLLFVIVGLGCIAGSNFLPKEEETTPTKKEEKKEPESAVVTPTDEKSVVETEINKLVKYLNLDVEDSEEEKMCAIHLGTLEPMDNEGSLLTPEFTVPMYECLHSVETVHIEDSPFGGDQILSTDQYNDFKKYFNASLNSFDEEIGSEKNLATGFDPTPYYGKGYYYGYECGDGFGSSGLHYKVESIDKNNNYYEIQIKVTLDQLDEDGINIVGTKDAYIITINAEVVGNYLKYNKIELKEV